MDEKLYKWLSTHAQQDDERPILSQIYIDERAPYGRVAVAADGFRMAIARVDDEPGLIPAHRKQAHDGTYPEWWHIVPDDSLLTTTVRVWTEDLAVALAQVDVFARESNHTVSLTADAAEQTLTIAAASSETGEIAVRLDARIEGDDPGLAASSLNLMQAISGWSKLSTKGHKGTNAWPAIRTAQGNLRQHWTTRITGCHLTASSDSSETVIRFGKHDRAFTIAPQETHAFRLVVIMPYHIATDNGKYQPTAGFCPECGQLTDRRAGGICQTCRKKHEPAPEEPAEMRDAPAPAYPTCARCGETYSYARIVNSSGICIPCIQRAHTRAMQWSFHRHYTHPRRASKTRASYADRATRRERNKRYTRPGLALQVIATLSDEQRAAWDAMPDTKREMIVDYASDGLTRQQVTRWLDEGLRRIANPPAPPPPGPIITRIEEPEPVREEIQPMTDKPAALELHPKVTLTPTKAARVLEHIEAVVEFAETGSLSHENGAKLVSYDTMTVIDLGGKRSKYSQWKAKIIAANVERVKAYVGSPDNGDEPGPDDTGPQAPAREAETEPESAPVVPAIIAVTTGGDTVHAITTRPVIVDGRVKRQAGTVLCNPSLPIAAGEVDGPITCKTCQRQAQAWGVELPQARPEPDDPPCAVCGQPTPPERTADTTAQGAPVCVDCVPDPERVAAYEERREERVNRYAQYAENARKRGKLRLDTAHRMASCIPFGQPILVGHHSEQRDRAYRRRIDTNYRKGFEEMDKAKHWERRAEVAERNDTIYTDDPAAAVKLAERITELERQQDRMRAANRIIKTSLPKPEKIHAIAKATGMTPEEIEELFQPDYLGRVGFPDYELRNNRSNIARLKQRLVRVRTQQQRPAQTVEVGEVEVRENEERQSTEIHFPGKPGDELRAEMKRHGWKWSRPGKCWYVKQRGDYILKQGQEFAAAYRGEEEPATV